MPSYLKILAYHSINDTANRAIYDRNIVEQGVFEQQLIYLLERYRIAPLEEIWLRLSGRSRSRDKVVALTFDDGYLDFYHHAYPLLRKHQIPATLFLCPAFLERPFGKWDDNLSLLLGACPDPGTFLGRLRAVIPQREFSCYQEVVYFLQRAEPEELAGMQQGIRSLCAEVAMPRTMLNWQEALEISRDVNVTIGSHTLSHYNLTVLDQATLRHELRESKSLLEEKLGTPVTSLCYPFGFCNEAVKRCAAEEGYAYAVACGDRYNTGKDDVYEMQRLVVVNSPLAAFRRRMSSPRYTLHTIKKGCLRAFTAAQ
jgi:peptidoglycan/xylan/chitin deacetylase (PgdA/CDA1 family)